MIGKENSSNIQNVGGMKEAVSWAVDGAGVVIIQLFISLSQNTHMLYTRS